MPVDSISHIPSSILHPPSSLPPLFIRADSTREIGTGHIMRCIALGQAWQDEGGKVVFISHCQSEKLRERISREGFELVTIDHPHPHPSDLELTLSTIKNISHSTSHLSLKQDTFTPSPSSVLHPPSSIWLILDGYHFTPEYQKAIRDAGIRLLVIDDMNHLPYYHADIILNQNIHATELKYNCDPDTKLLLGTKYVLLRREFLKYKDFKREISEKAKKILVTMGGADPDNVTLKVIQALNLLNDPDLEVKVVIGPANCHLELLQEAVLRSPSSILLLHSTDDMPSLMAWADLAISGAGSTVWELAFMGLPFFVIIVAENQKEVAEKLQSNSIAFNLGWYNDICPENISQRICYFIKDFEHYSIISNHPKHIVDGDGINRILMRLKFERVRLRQVTENDCELIWRWANDQDVRNSAFNSSPISWETHKDWFSKKLKDSNCVMFLAIDGTDEPVGQIRFDINKDGYAEVDVSVKKAARGKGLGSTIIASAVDMLTRTTDIKVIYAKVKMWNYRSIKAFEKAGFQVKKRETFFNQPVVELVWVLNE